MSKHEHPPGKILNREDIEKIVLERPPFFRVWRAEVVSENEIVGEAKITKDDCAGHFPGDGNLRVPLIRIQELHAQTGLLLYTLMQKRKGLDPRLVPIAFAHGSGWPLAQVFPRPELNLKIRACLAPRWSPLAFLAKAATKAVGAFSGQRMHCVVLNMKSTGRWPPKHEETPVARLQVYYIMAEIKMNTSATSG